MDVAELLQAAATAWRAGQLAQAEQCYRQILELDPGHALALGQMGLLAYHAGQLALAVDYFRRAAAAVPTEAGLRNNLGVVLAAAGQLADAEAAYHEALRLRPDYPEAYNNLGITLRASGRPTEAEAAYREALRLRPDYPEAHNNLGVARLDRSQPIEAEAAFREAARLRPSYAEPHNNLGNALRAQARLPEAEAAYREALRLRPDLAEAFNNLGNVWRAQGRYVEAEAAYREALRLRPDYPEPHNNLGLVLLERGRPTAAEESIRKALALRPDLAEVYDGLGNALREQSRPEEAGACFRKALALRPDYAVTHSNVLLTLHYRPGVTAAELAAAHADYERIHATPLRTLWRPHANNRDPERPLRLGFVSPDLGRHPVGYFLVRTVEALVRRPGAVVCYSGRLVPPDDVTARFRAAAGLWRETAGLSDEALAEQIRTDAIDVLIDLAGHTAGGRLLAFARRPAPVQCTWLGYEGTTGLEAIDYLIADERMVPSGAEVHYRERVLRLPGGYVTYDPPAAGDPPTAGTPDPGPPPALAKGRVTFGCFNNPAKLSDPALAAFADVLRRVPTARLLLKYRGLDEPTAAGRLRARLTAHGVGADRVELRGVSGYGEYLAAYRDVDVALDPWPFSGGVTTCDALWMGVPVVTLPGDAFASRHGLAYLASAGLGDEFVAQDAEGYAALAAGLAQDIGRLTELRAGLRSRLARSPLCDGDRLADELVTVLRGAWREWQSP